MLSVEQHKALEEIQRRGKIARSSAVCFIAVGLIGGIPVHDRPLIMLPSAMLLALLLSGFFWSLMVGCLAKRTLDRCPRCRDLFFRTRRMAFLPIGLRAIWGSHCSNCGLSFRDLNVAALHNAAAAALSANAIAATTGLMGSRAASQPKLR